MKFSRPASSTYIILLSMSVLMSQHFVHGNIWEKLRQPDYDSATDPAFAISADGWMSVDIRTTAYMVFHHGLNVVPTRVQVLVRAQNGANKDYVFEAMGSQQLTNNLDLPYGGVLYTYTSDAVRIWFPSRRNNINLGWPIFTGFPGWTLAYRQDDHNIAIRVRVWTPCNFPKPSFASEWFPLNSGKNDRFKEVFHGKDAYPDLVLVQARAVQSNSFFYYDGIGAAMTDEVDSRRGINKYGGIVFGYNQNYVRIWAPTGPSNAFVAMIDNSWGNGIGKFELDYVNVRVLVWHDLEPLTSASLPIGEKGLSGTLTHVLNLPSSQEWKTTDILISLTVEVTEAGNNEGFRFPGVGAGQTGAYSRHYNEKYGGVVYGVKEDSVRIWQPALPNGYLVSLGEGWGLGRYNQHAKEGKVVLGVYNASLSFDDNPCIPGTCINTESGYRCACPNPDRSGEHCQIGECGEPEVREGTDYSGDHQIGDFIKYFCLNGSVPLSGNTTRLCQSDGTWSGEPLLCAASATTTELTTRATTERDSTIKHTTRSTTTDQITTENSEESTIKSTIKQDTTVISTTKGSTNVASTGGSAQATTKQTTVKSAIEASTEADASTISVSNQAATSANLNLGIPDAGAAQDGAATTLQVGEIVGIVLAGILLIALIILIIAFVINKKKKNSERIAPQPLPTPVPTPQPTPKNLDLTPRSPRGPLPPIQPLRQSENYSYFAKNTRDPASLYAIDSPNKSIRVISPIEKENPPRIEDYYVDFQNLPTSSSPKPNRVMVRKDLPNVEPKDHTGRLSYETRAVDIPEQNDSIPSNRSSVLRLPSLPQLSVKVSENMLRQGQSNNKLETSYSNSPRITVEDD